MDKLTELKQNLKDIEVRPLWALGDGMPNPLFVIALMPTLIISIIVKRYKIWNLRKKIRGLEKT